MSKNSPVAGYSLCHKNEHSLPKNNRWQTGKHKQIEEYHPNQQITGEYDKSLAADCSNGIFVGTQKDDVIAWKGIPFATQPVGDKRFKKSNSDERLG